MHPFNGQQSQQYILASVGNSNIQSLPLPLPLTLPSTTSIRKIPATLPKHCTTINSTQYTIAPNTNSIINSNLINSSIVANNPSTNSISKSITNCLVPMLLTANNSNNSNSTSSTSTIANIDQHQQHLLTKGNAGIPIMASSKQVVITNSNNITYQVIAPASSANNLNTVIAPSNGTMSLLLTSSNTSTAGHATTGQIIQIRNTAIPVKQQQQQLHQYQLQTHQHQQTTTNATDIVKQVVIGKGNASNAAALIPRTTLLKPLMPLKPAATANPSGKTKILKTTKLIPYQQPAKLHAVSTSYENANQKILINQSMEMVNTTSTARSHDVNSLISSISSISATTSAKAPATPSTAPSSTKLTPFKEKSSPSSSSASNLTNSLQCNQQKIVQVSLLQNSKKNVVMKNGKNSLLKNAELKKVNNGAMKPIIKITSEHGNSITDKNIITLAQHPNTHQQLKASNTMEILKADQQQRNNNEEHNLEMIIIEAIKSTTTKNQFAIMEKPSPSSSSSSSSLLKTKIQNPPRYQRSLSLNEIGKTKRNLNGLKSNSNPRRYSVPLAKQNDISSTLNTLPQIISKETQLINDDNVEENDMKFIEIDSKGNEENLQKMECDTVVEMCDDVVEVFLENITDEKIDSKAAECNGDISKGHLSKDVNENCLQLLQNIDNREQATQFTAPTAMEASEASEMKIDKLDGDSDDDVTILPIEEVQIESIEIVDDDDDDDNHNDNNSNINVNNNHDAGNVININNNSNNKHNRNKKLLCGEKMFTTVSSKSTTSNKTPAHPEHMKCNIKLKLKTEDSVDHSPLLKKTLTDMKPSNMEAISYHSVVDILSHFNMLSWRERVGTAKGTKMRFQLNEFNLVQICEDCPPRNRVNTAYDKPLYERVCTPKDPDDMNPPLLYQCRRCHCHGPAIDFLAPEFCSLRCLKRDARKRMRDEKACILRKRSRKTEPMLIKTESTLARKFRWAVYMKTCPNTIAAPISLFLNPFPTGPNNFTVGMKLEAIDPDNCSLFCVCTIVGISGYRLKLHFDGYDSTYDFWVNADSMDIFPHGWCAKTGRILQPPKDIPGNSFNWPKYLHNQHAIAAPHHLFTHLKSSSSAPKNPFKIGMHLEAEDLNDTGKLCVATVADVLDDRIRIHFDGWDDCYDIIVDIHSPYIHPCGWHAGRHQLVVPPECENSSFHWGDYIRKRNCGISASAELFAPREPINFRPNMKLEVVDPRNPSLIRPATVVAHKGHRVKLHLDCWPNDYCFWLEDDSPDLHPIGWCDATDHHLEPPPGHPISTPKIPCPINGCRGIGNAKDPNMYTHTSRNCCPYAPENWRVIIDKPIRLNNDNIVRLKPTITLWKSSPLRNNNCGNEQPIIIAPSNILESNETLPSIALKQEKDSKNKEDNTAAAAAATAALLNKKSFIEMNSYSNLCDKIHINKEFLIDYGPRLQQNYTLWHKNFTIDGDKIHRNPLQWTAKETSKFVKDMLKCDDNIASTFLEEDIDGRAFLLLQQDDLTERLGFKLGKAVKLHTIILQLRTIAVVKFKTPYSRNFIK